MGFPLWGKLAATLMYVSLPENGQIDKFYIKNDIARCPLRGQNRSEKLLCLSRDPPHTGGPMGMHCHLGGLRTCAAWKSLPATSPSRRPPLQLGARSRSGCLPIGVCHRGPRHI